MLPRARTSSRESHLRVVAHPVARPADDPLDELVALAARCCGLPVAFLALAGPAGTSQLILHGASYEEMPAVEAVCTAAAATKGIVSADGLEGAHEIAALALRGADGEPRGTLGVLGAGAAQLDAGSRAGLELCAAQTVARLELIERIAYLERAEGPLRQRAEQQAAAADLGQRALSGLDLRELMQESAALVSERLGLDFCQIWELTPDGERLTLVGATGWRPQDVGRLTIAVDERSQPGFNLKVGGPVFIDDVKEDERFSPPEWVAEHGAVSGFSVSIPGPRGPFGVIGGHVPRHRVFTDDDASFVQSIANVLGAAIERRRFEQEVQHHANHDPLTGLANRALLVEGLREALDLGVHRGHRPAVLFLDLDRFKLVNDSLGHDVGDELLVALGARLRELLRPGDLLARFDGDEFVLLLGHVSSVRAAEKIAERLLAGLEEPLSAGGDRHYVTVCAGVAVAASRHSRPEMLLQEADAAMYRAKQRGRGCHEIYDRSMLATARRELRLEQDLRCAIDRQELSVLYQPLVSLATGEMLAAEALLRWTHSELGPIPPDVFVPVAEETGLIAPIGEWVLDRACAQMAAWNAQDPDRAPLPVSINVSARQVARPEFPAAVSRALEEHALNPEQLGLELTESALLEEVKAPMVALDRLRALGVRLMLDDFGTGYSSLSYLNRFPLDAIKLDRSFVGRLGVEDSDSAIVDAVLAMSRALGLTVVAEGVETHAQLGHLRRRGAEVGQGYLFAAPLTPVELWRFSLQDRNPAGR